MMIDPYRRRRAQGAGIQAREKTKMWLLAAVFVVLLASFVGFKLMATKPPGGEESGEGDETLIDTAEQLDEEGRPIVTVMRSIEEVRDRVEGLGRRVFGPANVQTEILNVPPMRVYRWMKGRGTRPSLRA